MSHAFDELSKSLADDSVPRRESLRRLGLVITGAVLGPLALGGEAAAGGSVSRSWSHPLRMIHKRQKSKRQRDVCLSFCKKCRTTKQKSQCLSACRECNGNTRNIQGRCGTYTCIDLTSDANCGAIGNNCSAGGKTCCGGTCRDVGSDNNNCGACGVACAGATPFCISGTCTAGGNECASGLTKCGTSCVNLSTDATNCGACGVVCGESTPYCSGGQCWDANCGGTDLNWDNSNCGACGNVCPPGSGCSFGVCHGTCVDC